MPDLEADLDATDRTILDLLAENARRTLGDIGERVGLSAPAVKRRIDRLEAAGVILGYTTRVDHAKLGRPLEAFTELRFSGDARVDAIAGDPDALAWIRVSDVHELKQVIDRLRNSGDVIGTKTLIVLGTSGPR